QNTLGIVGLVLDLSTYFTYPSVTYAGTLFLKPISQGLVQTEILYILENYNQSGQYISPYDPINSTMIFQMIGDEYEISLFTVNDATQEITWTDNLVYNIADFVPNVPL